MRIAFADFGKWDYHVQSVDFSPMGGSQSAACYLARALARIGHEVFFINRLSTPGIYDGVNCISGLTMAHDAFASMRFDAFICLLGAGDAVQLHRLLGSHTRLILWSQHATDQPAIQHLRDPAQATAYNGIALVSDWQRNEYLRTFPLNPASTSVMRNAVAPTFQNQFANSIPILPQKSSPPILAYTSTPFRGLDLLLQSFPRIRQQTPEARLQVFSSMKVYQFDQARDEANYGQLYQRCRQLEGAEYFGSIAQPELAHLMKKVSVLAYPNTFPETSCIAAMEAMASGCRIVTSALGALPETTAGFARLISFNQSGESYLNEFVHAVTEALNKNRQCPDESEEFLGRQFAYINSNAIWEIRAGEWVRWLESLQTSA
jgi:glycosyltransferase involved in cell wall biosynthesis